MNDLRVDGDKSTEVYTPRTSCLIEEDRTDSRGTRELLPLPNGTEKYTLPTLKILT